MLSIKRTQYINDYTRGGRGGEMKGEERREREKFDLPNQQRRLGCDEGQKG